jgi:hypothetical protein
LSSFVSAHRLCNMSTPNDERPEPTYGYNADRPGQSDSLHNPPAQLPSYNVNKGAHNGRRSYELNRSSDEEGTLHDDNEAANLRTRASGFPRRTDTLLTVETQYDRHDDIRSQASPSQTREQARRLDDDLELLTRYTRRRRSTSLSKTRAPTSPSSSREFTSRTGSFVTSLTLRRSRSSCSSLCSLVFSSSRTRRLAV